MSKKATEVKTNIATAAVAAAVVVAPTKSVAGIKIVQESYAASPVPARKDIIKRLIDEAGMTKNYAATFLQNFKRKEGLSKPRAVAQADVAIA